jgi:PAS domain S-box-containing protein
MRISDPRKDSSGRNEERLKELSTADLKKLIYELDSRQIELELQNEELRKARTELESSRARYADLFDFSPVGYFLVDVRGRIREANLTGADMMGVSRRQLTGELFAFFIEQGDLAAYERHRKETFRSQTPQTCELKIQPRNAPAFYGRLQSTIADNVDDKAGLIRNALIDISERKRAEEEREKVISELKIALGQIKTLTGLLPICAGCKKIRNDSGYWEQVEQFLSEHTEVTFTHGMCPECLEKTIGEFKKKAE